VAVACGLPGMNDTVKSFIRHCFLSEKISSPVLEIGSGKDRFNRELFSKRYKVITSNIYPKNIVDHICSVACLPFEDNKFGSVICEHVLEHVEDPKKAIDEIRRVLKPSGLLILVVPFNWPRHEKPYDLWRFTEEGLRVILAKHFEKIEFDIIGNLLKPRLYCVTARKPAVKRQAHHPKVSVIIPTYNRAGMLPLAIESILRQTYQDWELVIVSDGSTDNTAQVVRRYQDPRIKYYEKKNGGPSSARNLGLRLAQGEYIAYCDDDDTIAPYHLEVLVHYLDRHPEVAMVRGFAVEMNLIEPKKTGYLRAGFLWSCMHRHKNLKKKIYFDEKQHSDEDLDFILRFSDYYPVRMVNAVLAKRIVHKGNYMIVHMKYLDKYNERLYMKRIKMLCTRKSIERRYFLMLAYFLIQAKRLKAALELARFFQGRHLCIDAAYLQAWIYYRLGKAERAKVLLRRILYNQNRYSKKKCSLAMSLWLEYSYGFLSWIYSRQHNGKHWALKFAREGLQGFPKSNLLKLEIFHAYLENRKIKEALFILRKINNKTLRLYCKGVLALVSARYELGDMYFNKARPLDKVFKYRLYDSLFRLRRIKGDIAEADNYRQKAFVSSEYTWGYPLTRESNFSSIKRDEFRRFLGRVFLIDESHDQPILRQADNYCQQEMLRETCTQK
jgi:glycosyltransferase involved in cell wall biosynthesis